MASTVRVMQSGTEPSAYTAGYSVRSLWRFALTFILPVTFAVAGLWNWPQGWFFAVLGLGTAALLTGITVWRLRRIARGEAALVIDSHGVWLSGDGVRPPARVPWSDIDAVVYFDSWLQFTSESGKRVPHIGIVRHRQIFDVRNTSEWQIDREKAREAITEFGGVPFREAPVQDDVPRVRYQGMTLPHDWFTASP